MNLHSIEYTEFGDQSFAWSLNELTIIDINLVVGKNATGKSRLLRVINGLARLIDSQIAPNSLASGRYKAIFHSHYSKTQIKRPVITYLLDIHKNKVAKESLYVDDDLKLDRGSDGRGKLFFESVQDFIPVQIPESMLAASSRRDSQQHNFFEELHVWAKSVRLYEFNKTKSDEAFYVDGKLTFEAVEKGPLQNHLQAVVKLGKEHFRRDFESCVINDMRRIGYSITEFGLSPISGIPSNINFSNTPELVYLVEKGIDKKMLQTEVSDGMLRAFATLVHLHFIRLQKNYGCLLIDDIGEGLDFDRSTKLIEVIIEHVEKGFIQLIMTTNDRFVMNKVSLDYWSIMERNFGKIDVFNKRNSPSQFEEFEEYGFNNFDFFSKGLYQFKTS